MTSVADSTPSEVNSPGDGARNDDAPPAQVMIGQLTDCHVVAADAAVGESDPDANARLALVVDTMLAEPDPLAAIVATGDLTDDGRPEQYDALVELIAPITDRLLPLAGNHDRPAEVRRRFPAVPWADAEHVSWATTVAGVRLVGLDSTRLVDGQMQHGGQVDEERVEWLDGVLGEPHDGVTVLAMHHPPFASGIWWMDQHGFPGIDLLAEVLEGRSVDRIMCGHLHRPMSSMFAGAIAQVGMSTVQHVGPDFGSSTDVTVVDDPVGYQVLQVREVDVHAGPGTGPRAVLHHRYIPPSAEPVVPSWADRFRRR